MANYLVGDLQGELRPLQLLLEFVEFDSTRDYLWSAGDIVNRGAESLEVLRYFYHHADHTRMVLGNHDIHLLLIGAGIRQQNRGDTLTAVLEAPDKDELLHWIRHQPLLRTIGNDVLVHAGIPPNWNLSAAQNYAREVEDALQGPNYLDFLKELYGDEPNCWSANLSGVPRLRLICNYLTRMRFCAADGTLAFNFTGKIADAPKGLGPWFAHPSCRDKHMRVFFGHWAALREYHPTDNVYALDGGWIWGNQLRLLRIEDMQLYQCEHSDQSIHSINP